MKKRDEEDTNKEKNLSDKLQEMIGLNENYRKEINDFENEKDEISSKLSNLKTIMESNKTKNEVLKQEYIDIEKEIEKNKEEYTKKQIEDEEKKKKEKLEYEEKEFYRGVIDIIKVGENVNEENCDLVNSIIKENSASRNYDLIRIVKLPKEEIKKEVK